MCGIVGFTGKKDFRKLSKLLAVVEHRGRDGKTLHWADGVHMGMNRLAIIDPTRNPYPVKYKQYVLLFNGEIYNFQKLKGDLTARGIRFHTACDAEVILPLFHLYGFGAFSMLEGMFAISIIDTIKKQLILVRDKSGEKPLYIRKTPTSFIYSSEIKVLLVFDKKQRRLDTGTLHQYLRQGFVFAPNTLVKGIKKVPPGRYVVYDLEKETIKAGQYWSPIHRQRLLSKTKYTSDPIKHIEALLRESVRLRLIADVPVGCFLSGGIDSSLITLFASQKKRDLRTYSVSFPGYSNVDESAYATFVARFLHTKHTVIPCTAENVTGLLDHIGTLIDEPIIDPAVLPTLLMAQEARKRVKVALTGEGADELFGGYTRYHKQLVIEGVRSLTGIHPLLPKLWSYIFRTRFQNVTIKLSERYSPQSVWNTGERATLLKGAVQKVPLSPYLTRFASSNPLLAMQLTDYRGYMAEQLLMKIDKSTMAYNLEARAPYLDTNIISFAFGLPDRLKRRGLQGKYIIRKVAEKYFPHAFVWRPKHGFDVPLRDWFRNQLHAYVFTSVDYAGDYSKLFDVYRYQQIVQDHMEKRKDNSDKIWSMLVLTSWMKTNNISV